MDIESRPLNRTFAALADPTRRAIVARLAGCDGLNVGAIAAPFAMSLPAVIKHLDVLSEAGLMVRDRSGRSVTCRLVRAPMNDAMAWLDKYLAFWEPRLDALQSLLERKPDAGSDDGQHRSGTEIGDGSRRTRDPSGSTDRKKE